MSITSISSQAADARLQGLAQQAASRMSQPTAAAAAQAAPTPATAATDATSPEAAAQPTSLEQVQQAMEDVRKAITPVAQDLLFSIDEDTGKTIVKVVDASTDEVIRQIPSEEIISIAKALDKLQGLLVQQKA
ncbi:flagellar protein [Azoarcus sp. DD4]|uniref:flagellar protein FlaG n=1 Tax=Azoarcus sp. DD4 TaxID=2027405 RepID=UPI001129DB47|nr:flagellar protein FlaG [Azoarcus sp. DD4]QDF96489.1 flagellar protein [Azoarcus sp. DD4]